MKRREILQASFNMEEVDEKELYEYAKTKGNSSKYIKRLILLDKEGVKESTMAMYQLGIEEENDDNDDDVSSFI